MRIHRDCLPCIRRQISEAVRMATHDVNQISGITSEADKILERYTDYCCTPDLVMNIHSVISEITGNIDPYKEIKERDIGAALALYPLLKSYLSDNGNDVSCALRISATGNIIDSAINLDLDIGAVINEELEKPFVIDDSEAFTDRLKEASTLLIVGDNSGETVFDRVLAESLSTDIIYSVRSHPILNDVTMTEALDSGLGECTTLISTGCAAPGAVLSKCSNEFREIFESADIVISKGQGNYEALSDAGREIFFLLKAKCPVIADELGVKTGDHVLKLKAKT